MTSRIDDALSFQSKALGLRAYRQQILAGNIANADTPNYKARDFDFKAAFSGARRDADLRLAQTSGRHLDGASGPAGMPELQYRHPVQPSIDGNTVEMDAEVGRFSDNAMRYQASMTFASHTIRELRAAIQGQ